MASEAQIFLESVLRKKQVIVHQDEHVSIDAQCPFAFHIFDKTSGFFFGSPIKIEDNSVFGKFYPTYENCLSFHHENFLFSKHHEHKFSLKDIKDNEFAFNFIEHTPYGDRWSAKQISV